VPVIKVPLEETALFRALDRARIERLRPHVRLVPVVEGEYLYFESEPAVYLYAVRSGGVRTLKNHPGGRVITLEQLAPGELFGLAALAGAARYTESAQSLGSGEVWRVPRRAIAAMLEDDPGLARALLAIVAGRLQHAHDRLCSFASDSVTARMARALLESDDGSRIETTRRILGESAGTTVETAIRVLRRFEQRGWLEGGVGWVRVLDRAALERIAHGGESERAS
jgi:CRP-like cAMP-binding protein